MIVYQIEDTARLLLDRGIDMEATDIYGKTALHVAAKYNTTECGELLLQRGAKISSWTTDSSGESTPLHYACLSASHETALLLVEWGADLDIRNKVHSILSITRPINNNFNYYFKIFMLSINHLHEYEEGSHANISTVWRKVSCGGSKRSIKSK